jgi:S1-C subfamily serine protease
MEYRSLLLSATTLLIVASYACQKQATPTSPPKATESVTPFAGKEPAASPLRVPRSEPEIVKDSMAAVVLLVGADASGENSVIGSGFVISQDGVIVTNYHVIEPASRMIAKFSTGVTLPIEQILVRSPEDDIAILRVSATRLRYLEFGDSSVAQPGEHVLVIGNPLGLQGAVSDGIVSGMQQLRNRTWIQTTAPVSPGNSGGPLIDTDGKVIGVVTRGIKSEFAQNINFAVPINTVKALLPRAYAPPLRETERPNPSASYEAASENSSSSAGIQDVLTHWVNSFRMRDAAAQADCYAPVVETYFRWHNIPNDQLRRDKQTAFLNTAEVRQYEISDVSISADPDGRYTAILRKKWDAPKASGKPFSGEEIQRLRFAKVGTKWKIVSEEELKIIRVVVR